MKRRFFFIMRDYGEKQMGDKQICYCFGYTDADIKRDVLQNGKSRIMEKIMADKKRGVCQCATKNPKGR